MSMTIQQKSKRLSTEFGFAHTAFVKWFKEDMKQELIADLELALEITQLDFYKELYSKTDLGEICSALGLGNNHYKCFYEERYIKERQWRMWCDNEKHQTTVKALLIAQHWHQLESLLAAVGEIDTFDFINWCNKKKLNVSDLVKMYIASSEGTITLVKMATVRYVKANG